MILWLRALGMAADDAFRIVVREPGGAAPEGAETAMLQGEGSPSFPPLAVLGAGACVGDVLVLAAQLFDRKSFAEACGPSGGGSGISSAPLPPPPPSHQMEQPRPGKGITGERDGRARSSSVHPSSLVLFLAAGDGCYRKGAGLVPPWRRASNRETLAALWNAELCTDGSAGGVLAEVSRAAVAAEDGWLDVSPPRPRSSRSLRRSLEVEGVVALRTDVARAALALGLVGAPMCSPAPPQQPSNSAAAPLGGNGGGVFSSPPSSATRVVHHLPQDPQLCDSTLAEADGDRQCGRPGALTTNPHARSHPRTHSRASPAEIAVPAINGHPQSPIFLTNRGAEEVGRGSGGSSARDLRRSSGSGGWAARLQSFAAGDDANPAARQPRGSLSSPHRSIIISSSSGGGGGSSHPFQHPEDAVHPMLCGSAELRADDVTGSPRSLASSVPRGSVMEADWRRAHSPSTALPSPRRLQQQPAFFSAGPAETPPVARVQQRLMSSRTSLRVSLRSPLRTRDSDSDSSSRSRSRRSADGDGGRGPRVETAAALMAPRGARGNWGNPPSPDPTRRLAFLPARSASRDIHPAASLLVPPSGIGSSSPRVSPSWREASVRSGAARGESRSGEDDGVAARVFVEVADCITSFLGEESVANMIVLSRRCVNFYRAKLLYRATWILSLSHERARLLALPQTDAFGASLADHAVIGRDAFRLVNVACELVRGERCLTYDACVATMRAPDFLHRLASLSHQAISGVALHTAALVARRIDSRNIPDTLLPLHAFVCALLRVSPAHAVASRFCANSSRSNAKALSGSMMRSPRRMTASF